MKTVPFNQSLLIIFCILSVKIALCPKLILIHIDYDDSYLVTHKNRFIELCLKTLGANVCNVQTETAQI